MFAEIVSARASYIRQLRAGSASTTACRKPLREDNGLRSAATFPGVKMDLLVQQERLDGSNYYATGP